MPIKSEKFECVLCDKIVGPWSRGITFHAKTHNLTTEQFWLLTYKKSIPTCQCKSECQESTTFRNWHEGYDVFSHGHYSKFVRSLAMKKRTLMTHWSRGKTKETDNRLVDAGIKTSKTLRKLHASHDIVIWSTGKSKKDNDLLLAKSESMRGKKCHFYDVQTISLALNDRLSDRFSLITPIEDIAKRTNNREKLINVCCKRCSSVMTISIYNVIRKNKQRCKHCDVPRKWISTGELQLVKTLETMFVSVKHTTFVNGWSIDVFVKDINTYFQFDGVYWHGLDRPENEIIDPKILKKVIRDKQQNLWFSENLLNLVRITEIQWSQAKDKVLLINQLLGM